MRYGKNIWKIVIEYSEQEQRGICVDNKLSSLGHKKCIVYGLSIHLKKMTGVEVFHS